MLCSTLLCVLGSYQEAIAQSKAQAKAAQRYEIEAKRMGVDASSDDALPRSREFIRIDSSYYVGWFYEGFYKYLHAADYLGFKNAIPPLEKALYLLERDYGKELSTRSSDIQVYFPVYNFQLDYGRIAAALRECYANTEQAEKVVLLMRRALRWKFQKEYFLDPYNYLAWITHRYRFYTKKQFAFLGNSIQENEQLAMRYLDSSLRSIAQNKKYNEGLFRPGYDLADKMGVYHYKCILYSYALNIDSAERYYGLMRRNNALPHNNYANFKSVCGDFRTAEKEYKIASGTETGDKRLQEWAYYTSILSIGKAKPKQGAALAESMIKGFGSSPGFGWYNIALSRALAYDGQWEAAQSALSKAQGFKELHIGTTLGQSHYEFSIQLLKLIQQEQAIERIKFENKHWWYTPSNLGQITKMAAERLMLQYLIINQFAQNPERDRVVYKLFSTESTIGWDEVWYLIKDFSTAFFVKKFEQELKENKRKPIEKYFRLFLAKLYLKQGEVQKAKVALLNLLKDQTIDQEYEQLFLARCYQALAECAESEKNSADQAKWRYKMMCSYPQLMPFAGQKLPIKLNSKLASHPVIKALRNCALDEQAPASYSAFATIDFLKKGAKNIIRYQVKDAQSKVIVSEQSFSYHTPEQAGKELAYKLCGIGGENPKEKEPQ